MNESSVVSVVGEYHGTSKTLDTVILKLYPNVSVENFDGSGRFYDFFEVVMGGFIHVSVIYENGMKENSGGANILILGSSPTTDCGQLVDVLTNEAGIKVLQRAAVRGGRYIEEKVNLLSLPNLNAQDIQMIAGN